MLKGLPYSSHTWITLFWRLSMSLSSQVFTSHMLTGLSLPDPEFGQGLGVGFRQFCHCLWRLFFLSRLPSKSCTFTLAQSHREVPVMTEDWITRRHESAPQGLLYQWLVYYFHDNFYFPMQPCNGKTQIINLDHQAPCIQEPRSCLVSVCGCYSKQRLW